MLPQDAESLRRFGFTVDPSIIGCNAAVYVSGGSNEIVTKRYAAEGESIEQGTGLAIVKAATQAGERSLGLAICKDYLRDLDKLRGRQERVVAVLASTLTRQMADFADPAPRDFIRVIANWAFDGGTTVVAPGLQGLFAEKNRSEPVSAEDEAIVIVDWDYFPTKIAPLDLPRNRVVHYAAIIDDESDPDSGELSVGASVRQMDAWNLSDLRAGVYSQILRPFHSRHHHQSSIVRRVLTELTQPVEDSAILARDDFACLTSHVVLDDILREEELRYRLLEDLIERWHDDRRAFPSAESGRFIALAEAQRRKLEPRIRPKYRSQRQVAHVAARTLVLDDRQGAARQSGLETFYSARLGRYRGERAIETLPRQLDLLRTIADSSTESLHLVYRISTEALRANDLIPYFDVVAAADPGADMEALVAGIGEQIGTILRGAWDVTARDASVDILDPWIVRLQLDAEYVPAIQDDWSHLIDYLRTLDEPTHVQMTISPTSTQAESQCTESLEEPLGFFSQVEQLAAGFLTRARRAEAASAARLELTVQIGAAHALPEPVIQTIAQWLLRSDQYKIEYSAGEPKSTSGGSSSGAAILTPAQMLRIFHPPYGTISSRGLLDSDHTDVPFPSLIPAVEGIEIGRARVTHGKFDRTTPIRLNAKSRQHHVYILGRSGSGKTNLLKNMARQDIAAGHGVAVIDPHGDLVDYLAEQVAGRESDVYIAGLWR